MDINKFINRGLDNIPDDPYGLLNEKTNNLEIKKYFSKILRMHNNENIFGVSTRVINAINETSAYSNMYPEGSHRAIREKLAGKLGISPNNLIITNGGDELIYYTAMAFINDEDEIILPEVTFSVYNVAYKIMRANIIYSKMNGLEIDLGDILNRITNKTKVIVICNPNNPTGLALGEKSFVNFLRNVPSEVIVIVDEAYKDFVSIKDYPNSISLLKESYENILILRTFSKSYGIAGLRVGYGISKEEIIKALYKVKLPFNVSIISQFAALAAIEDKEFYKKVIDGVKAGRQYLYENFRKLNLSYEESNTNFILVHTGNKTECIVRILKQKKIYVLHTKSYGLPNSIRVTIGSLDQNELFINTLKDALKKCNN